ncbi:MAG: hypothetical protein GWO04_21130, partial [Actinobacteria bacterium]|nr:hypothetical protein [Actinomycetota bacterium]
QLATTVTDGRGFPTVYTLNQYGSTTSILDSEGNVTRMEWADDDVVMTARVDGNGVRTDLTYDGDGNLLTETVTVHHVDGTS